MRVPRKLSVKERMSRSITLRKGEVIMRSDFVSMGSQSQLTRALNSLVEEGKIVRIGYGVYAKARASSISGKPVPRVTLEALAEETLRKIGVEPRVGSALRAYNERRTDQIPVRTVYDTGRRRISRKITVGARSVNYENDYRSRI